MVKDQYIFLTDFYNTSIGCSYRSLDHELKLGTTSLHGAKHQGVSKLVSKLIDINKRLIYITCMFSPFFSFTSRCLNISFLHPQWLNYSFPVESYLTVSIFFLKERTCGKLYFPKMAKVIFLVSHVLSECHHSLTN